MPFKRKLETISHISSLWKSQWGGGTHYPGVKWPPHPSTLMYASFLYNVQRDWEEPGYLKFLNTREEDIGNNFSYFVPMNIVIRGWGTNYPRVKLSVSPPQPWCTLSLLCYDKGNEKSWWTQSMGGGGGGGKNLPRVKVSPPLPLSSLMYAFIFM